MARLDGSARGRVSRPPPGRGTAWRQWQPPRMHASGPDIPGKPGEVRLFRLFCHRGAVRVNEPRKERVFVVIDACQAPPGKHGGDRGLPGASTAGNQHCAHRCLSSAIPEAAQRVCGPAGDGWTDVNRRGHPDSTRCAGIIQSAVPRNVPRGRHAMILGRNGA
jgi:hypothetical protein